MINDLFAMTITIPNWIFNGSFWGGFCISTIIILLILGWIISKTGPRF